MKEASRSFRAGGIPMIFLALAGMSLGCAGRSPGQLSRVPRPNAPAAPPSITNISPDAGSTGGYTPMTITGTGFQPGATVTLGGSTLQGRFDRGSSATLQLRTPAHAAGTVDLLVTNPDGQAHRLRGAYTYAPPDSLDFNGSWRGQTGARQQVHVIIENNLLMSVACNGFTFVRHTFSPPPAVTDGEFSFAKGDAIAVSGRIVSATTAVGTIDLAPCTSSRWTATKQRHSEVVGIADDLDACASVQGSTLMSTRCPMLGTPLWSRMKSR